MKQLLLSLLVVTLVFTACKKEAPVIETQDQLMRTGKWRISSSMINLKMFNGKRKTIDYGKYRKSCIKDNYLKFDSLNRGSVLNGGVSCTIGDADSIGFIWTLKNNGTGIDILNCYTLIDSLSQTLFYNADNGKYEAQYDSASSYRANLYNAVIEGFSKSSFTLKYDLPAHYLDTTAAKGGSETAPVTLLDTFHVSITYTNF